MSEKNKSTDKPKKTQPKSADLKVTTTSNHSVTPSRSVSRSHSKSSRKSANASASGKSSRPSSAASIKTPPTTLIAPSGMTSVLSQQRLCTTTLPFRFRLRTRLSPRHNGHKQEAKDLGSCFRSQHNSYDREQFEEERQAERQVSQANEQPSQKVS